MWCECKIWGHALDEHAVVSLHRTSECADVDRMILQLSSAHERITSINFGRRVTCSNMQRRCFTFTSAYCVAAGCCIRCPADRLPALAQGPVVHRVIIWLLCNMCSDGRNSTVVVDTTISWELSHKLWSCNFDIIMFSTPLLQGLTAERVLMRACHMAYLQACILD